MTVGANDLARATQFYDAVLATLELERCDTWPIAIGYGPKGFSGANAPFWVMAPIDGAAAMAGNGVTAAFVATTRAAVDAFHAAALAAGGTDAGAPGIRKQYHWNYYGAYARDPDGNKICAVCHAPG